MSYFVAIINLNYTAINAERCLDRRIKMTTCLSCKKEMKCIGAIINMFSENTINLYVCFNDQCDRVLLTQVGSCEVEE